MGRRKKEPGQTMTYITAGLTAEELDLMERTMAFYRCSQSAAIRLLIRNGALTTPMAAPSPPKKEDDQ
jgi:hypothetical protein